MRMLEVILKHCAKEILAKNLPREQSIGELKATANTIIQQWRPRLNERGSAWRDFKISPTGSNAVSASFALGEKPSASASQQVFIEMFETGRSDAVIIIDSRSLAQVSDTGAIEKFCDEAIAANPNPVADYKAGKVAALNFLKGQVMKLSKGKANPALVGEILERKLKG